LLLKRVEIIIGHQHLITYANKNKMVVMISFIALLFIGLGVH